MVSKHPDGQPATGGTFHTSDEHEYDSWHLHLLGCSFAARLIERELESLPVAKKINRASTRVTLIVRSKYIHKCTRFDE